MAEPKLSSKQRRSLWKLRKAGLGGLGLGVAAGDGIAKNTALSLEARGFASVRTVEGAVEITAAGAAFLEREEADEQKRDPAVFLFLARISGLKSNHKDTVEIACVNCGVELRVSQFTARVSCTCGARATLTAFGRFVNVTRGRPHEWRHAVAAGAGVFNG